MYDEGVLPKPTGKRRGFWTLLKTQPHPSERGSKAPNDVYHVGPRVGTWERNEDISPVDQVQDKNREIWRSCLSLTCVQWGESVAQPSTTSSYPSPLAVKDLCRDVEWHGPRQLIHTQHSGGSKNALAILSFKNTDSYRFRHNCQCSSREEGEKKKKKEEAWLYFSQQSDHMPSS